MIRKEGSQYVLCSKDVSKVLGRGTKEEMLKREREVNYFKQKKGGR